VTNQNVSPQPIYALSEGAQLIDIARNSVVLVVAVDDLPQPSPASQGRASIRAAKLGLDGLRLRKKTWSICAPARSRWNCCKLQPVSKALAEGADPRREAHERN
jgi:hypothetical protein